LYEYRLGQLQQSLEALKADAERTKSATKLKTAEAALSYLNELHVIRHKWVAAFTNRVFIADSCTTNRVESFFSRLKSDIARPVSLSQLLMQITSYQTKYDSRLLASGSMSSLPTSSIDRVYLETMSPYAEIVEKTVREIISRHLFGFIYLCVCGGRGALIGTYRPPHFLLILSLSLSYLFIFLFSLFCLIIFLY
jgi:hypothetical protein